MVVWEDFAYSLFGGYSLLGAVAGGGIGGGGCISKTAVGI